MICHCGQTIIEPPVPCGTRISCSYPCSRPPPPCGHPKSPHSCHEDPTPCPPCPFLTSKVCACGKNTVPNIRCSQEKVSCGTACGKSVHLDKRKKNWLTYFVLDYWTVVSIIVSVCVMAVTVDHVHLLVGSQGNFGKSL